MLFIYPAVIHEDIDGMWAEFPDLEGCTTYGETMEEILSGAAEAMELYVLGLLEDAWHCQLQLQNKLITY